MEVNWRKNTKFENTLAELGCKASKTKIGTLKKGESHVNEAEWARVTPVRIW